MKQSEDLKTQELQLPKKLGRPATGHKTAAERQRISRKNRKAERFESFSAQQISYMLNPEASRALQMLAINCDMSQKEVIEKLLINAYDIAHSANFHQDISKCD